MAKRKKANNDKALSYIYGSMLIVIALIAFFNERTAFLGAFFRGSGNYLFGEYWILIYILIALVGVYLILTNTLPRLSNLKVIGLGVFALAIMLLSAMTANKDRTGQIVLKDFLENSKLIYSGNYPSGGGLIGTLIYTGISAVAGYFGSLLCLIILLVLSFMFIFDINAIIDSAKSFFIRQRNNAAKKAKQKVKEKPVEKKKAEKPVIEPNFIEYVPKHEVNEPVIEEKKEKKKVEEKTANVPVIEEKPVTTAGTSQKYVNYELPRLTILPSSPIARSSSNKSAARIKGQRLIEILDEFGLNCTLQDVFIGPSVTKFEIKPERGLNVKRFASVADNLKMELEVKYLRIEAPVPGKNVVGVEIPNNERSSVYLREVLENVDPKESNNPLMFALGKDLSGKSVVASMDKMPHLLIAGSTGSGKSVCVNSIIMSFLLRTKPDEVKLLLVDPKKVEFQPYENIPHLLAPVVTDCDKAAADLNILTQIMDNRYTEFQNCKVRNIKEYNEQAEKDPKKDKMYYIVVIIDEMADLMLTHGKEINSVIQRLTQLARACGIYLILSTQRPSTDVITGIIKANIPSRIALSVANGIDSRVILDETGAEDLLGNGDMLFKPIGSTTCERLQGVYVSDSEIEKITNYVRKQADPMFNDAFMAIDETLESDEYGAAVSTDPMYEKVKKMVIETGKASTSYIQRYFGIGYNRAARMIDSLQQEGIIGEANGSKPREVFYRSMEELPGNESQN